MYKLRVEDEISKIVDINDKTFPQDPLNEIGKCWILKNTKTNKDVAFVMTHQRGRTTILARVGVTASDRGKGLQLKMMKYIENYAKNMGYSEIISHVKTSNVASLRNFIKAKFKPYWPKSETRYEDEDIVYFIKKLH